MNTFAKGSVAAAGLVVVAVVGWRFASSSVGSTPTATPAASVAAVTSATTAPTVPPAPTDPPTPPCEPSGISVRYNPRVGADTIRKTELVVINQAAAPCSIAGGPQLTLLGSDGTAIAQSAGSAMERINLVPAKFYSNRFVFESWCSPNALLPLTLVLSVDGSPTPVLGWTIDDPADLPSCRTGDGTVISATEWLLHR
jgi:hypothetical protein